MNSPKSENLLKTPISYKYITKIPKNKNTIENFSLTNQHMQEIYKINTTTPLIYTKIIKYFTYIILEK